MTRKSDPRTTRLPVPARELPAFTPVPRLCVRHDGWTPERQQAFIEALADTGSVAAACRTVNMSAEGAYYLRRQPGAESFRAAWQSALDLGVQRLEDVAMERALNGIDVPVYSYGALIGTRKSYNDRLLMFLLRNRAPERFGKHGSDLKGLNAVGKMEKARLKKKWRKEWEAEQRQTSPAEVRSRIDAKLEGARRAVEARRAREWQQMSEETRAAWDRFKQLRDADFERLKANAEFRQFHEQGPEDEEDIRARYPRVKRPEPEPEVFPKWHGLRDSSWD